MTATDNLKDRAEAVIDLRARVMASYNRGENDPATDEFKAIDAAYGIALDNFRKSATPEVVLELIAVSAP